MMTAAERKELAAIVAAAVNAAFEAKLGPSCAELKVAQAEMMAFRKELAPLREALVELKALPGAVRTLQTYYLELKPLLVAHTEDIRQHQIKLGYLERLDPMVARLNSLIEKLIPTAERALTIAETASRDADEARKKHDELRDSLTELEKLTGEGKRTGLGQ
jgi:chromosome segregation ATPase